MTWVEDLIPTPPLVGDHDKHIDPVIPYMILQCLFKVLPGQLRRAHCLLAISLTQQLLIPRSIAGMLQERDGVIALLRKNCHVHMGHVKPGQFKDLVEQDGLFFKIAGCQQEFFRLLPGVFMRYDQ